MAKEATKYIVKPFWTRITAFSLLAILLVSGIAQITTRNILALNLQSNIGHKVEEGFHTVSAPASSEQLGQAIKAAEEADYTHGYTNWIWKSKCGDIGFWYQTLKQAKADVDRASYERAWSPEADENVILQRHYFVLTTTFGADMMPCGMHLMPHKAFFDLWAWSLLPNFIGAGVFMIVQEFSGSRVSTSRCIVCLRIEDHHAYRYLYPETSGHHYTAPPMRGFFGKLVRAP